MTLCHHIFFIGICSCFWQFLSCFDQNKPINKKELKKRETKTKIWGISKQKEQKAPVKFVCTLHYIVHAMMSFWGITLTTKSIACAMLYVKQIPMNEKIMQCARWLAFLTCFEMLKRPKGKKIMVDNFGDRKWCQWDSTEMEIEFLAIGDYIIPWMLCPLCRDIKNDHERSHTRDNRVATC